VSSNRKTAILSPEMGARLAWKLTGLYSENSTERDEAQYVKQMLDGLKNNVNPNDMVERDYVQNAINLIKASERNFQIIIDGRNLNLKEENELREMNQENILYYSQFTSNLQSLIPRIGSMTVVGAGGGITVSQLFSMLPGVPSYVLPLVIAAGAAIGYLLHGLVVVPIAKRKFQRDKIRADYHRNLYFLQYAERTRNALTNLYNALENCHQNYFNQKYNKDANPLEVADQIMEGISSKLCIYAHKHMEEGRITADLWAKCESGQGVRSCPLWEGKKEIVTDIQDRRQ
jgi:hypothetical protein